ncbi:aminoglycoside phosphotransferase family protein [Kribbella sp. NPDC026611]|uniref:aminoglycoside phosphotransferase family protein n=1 Tax=Kribbella sp. NPDC026611 TaxID=3154911 RepID=UPI003404A157
MAVAIDRETAYGVAQEVAARLGVDQSEPELLGPVADNAVFRLPGRMVARISGAAAYERALREVQTGRWLAGQGMPAVRPLESTELPWLVDGYVVTIWHEVLDAAMASTAELAMLLRQLHSLPVPTDFEIPRLDPSARLRDHLAAGAPALSEDDREFLSRRLDELLQDYEALAADLSTVVIHGDANRKNAIRGSDGSVVLLDLERFSLGPREWDLVVPAVYQRLGWYDDAEYAAFVDGYGWDVRTSPGFGTLAALRELRMTLWLISRLPREPRLTPEADNRIASLRAPDAPRSWTPGT